MIEDEVDKETSVSLDQHENDDEQEIVDLIDEEEIMVLEENTTNSIKQKSTEKKDDEVILQAKLISKRRKSKPIKNNPLHKKLKQEEAETEKDEESITTRRSLRARIKTETIDSPKQNKTPKIKKVELKKGSPEKKIVPDTNITFEKIIVP